MLSCALHGIAKHYERIYFTLWARLMLYEHMNMQELSRLPSYPSSLVIAGSNMKLYLTAPIAAETGSYRPL